MSSHLPKSEQLRLVRAAQAGSKDARDRLVETNLAFLHHQARGYEGRGVEHEDLVQEGAVGMIRAIEKFDLGRPVGFLTYAAWWVRQAMGRLCEQQGTVARFGHRVPAHVSSAMTKIADGGDKLEDRLGRAPTDAELAALAEASLQTVQAARRLAEASAARDSGEPGEREALMERLPDSRPGAQAQAEEAEQAAALERMVSRLAPGQREILARRFGLDGLEASSEQELCREWGVSRGRLQALRAGALDALRADPDAAVIAQDSPPQRMQAKGEVARIPGAMRAGRRDGLWWLVTSGPAGREITLSAGPAGEMLSPEEAFQRLEGRRRRAAEQLAGELEALAV